MRKILIPVVLIVAAGAMVLWLKSGPDSSTAPSRVSVSKANDSSARNRASVGSSSQTGSPPAGLISSTTAIATAQELAATNSDGSPALRQPSTASEMTFQAALSAIGSSPDYSLDASAPVWLVQVFAAPAATWSIPPKPGQTTTTESSALRTYSTIIDATTGRLVVVNQ
jgi:hypothetical protein